MRSVRKICLLHWRYIKNDRIKAKLSK